MQLFLATYAYTLVMDGLKTLFELFLISFRKDRRELVKLTEKDACIIIPCYNSAGTILKTLGNLPKEYKVFFALNGCTDSTREIVKQYCEKNPYTAIIEQEKPGKIMAVYVAALRAKQEGFTHFLMIDDDVKLVARHGEFELLVKDPSAPCTAFPVLPTAPLNLIEKMQVTEYEFMCASKAAQGILGNTIMASGAGGCFRVDDFLAIARNSDGQHVGDDWQISALYHTRGAKIDFVPEVVIETYVPATFSAWWKQRARWEKSPVKNWRLALKILLGFRAALWIRFLVFYRMAAQVNDVLRLVSMPVALWYYPQYFIGLLAISYFLMYLKIKMYRRVYPGLRCTHTPLFPLYTQLMWLSRLCALPKALVLAFKKYPKLYQQMGQ